MNTATLNPNLQFSASLIKPNRWHLQLSFKTQPESDWKLRCTWGWKTPGKISPNMNIREGKCFLWEKKLGGKRWWCRNVLTCISERRKLCFYSANWHSIYFCQLYFCYHFLGFLLTTPKIKNSDYYLQVSLLTTRRHRQ